MEIPWKLVIILAVIALIATYFLSGSGGTEEPPRQLTEVVATGPARA